MSVRRPITYISEFAVIIGHIIQIARPIVRQVAMLMNVDGKLDPDELLARGLARLTHAVIQAVRYGKR